MKLLLLSFFVGTTLTAAAQTSTRSSLHSQINDDEKTLSIQIDGQHNGRDIAYYRTFAVRGLSKADREAIIGRVHDSLGLGDVPAPPKPLVTPPVPGTAPTATKVTFVCPSCTGKTKLIVNGSGFSLERKSTIGRDKPGFPFEVEMEPGEYQYTYWQNGVEQMQLPFTVRAGKRNEITVK